MAVGVAFAEGVGEGVAVCGGTGVAVTVDIIVGFGIDPQADRANSKNAVLINLRKSRWDNRIDVGVFMVRPIYCNESRN
jgi:DUF1009 family protein